jgi:hypothetical protein
VGIGTKRKKDFYSFNAEYARAYTTSRRSKIWFKIISKSKYEVEILLESDDHNFIKEKEKEFIKLYGRIDLGTGTLCNLTDGGEGSLGRIQSEEEKLKRANKLRGRKRSPEFVEYIRKINTGKKRSEEFKINISIRQIGRKHSEKTKRRMSLASPRKKLTDEHKLKLIQASMKKIYQFSLDNEFIKSFDSGTEASSILGILRTSITNCLSKRTKQAGGYRWSYNKNLN